MFKYLAFKYRESDKSRYAQVKQTALWYGYLLLVATNTDLAQVVILLRNSEKGEKCRVLTTTNALIER